MLRASIGFCALGLVTLALGAYDIAGIPLELGRLLFFVFLGLAILTFLGELLTGHGIKSAGLLGRVVLAASLLTQAVPVVSISVVHADEGIKRQAENTADDAKKDTQKIVRKSKKSVRKAAGNDSAAKDAKDSIADARDEATAAANKAKRKTDSE